MKFQPHQANNAISRVSFVCEFAQPLGDERLREFEKLHSSLRNDFPKLDLGRGLTIQIGSVAAPVPVESLVAVTFQDYGRDGEVIKTFQAQQMVMAFAHNRYTHWSDVWTQAKTVLLAALNAIPHIPIQGFGLEYTDRFSAPASDAKPDVTALFKRDTQYLVPRVFDIPGLWHSHHGSLVENEASPFPHSKNENINVDLIREQSPAQQFVVNVLLRHRRILAQTTLASISTDRLEAFMEEMHQADRLIMRDLLTGEMAKQIGLDATND